LGISSVGFYLQVLHHHFECFSGELSPSRHLDSDWVDLEVRRTSHHFVFLRSREIRLRSGSETSPTGLSWPDLHSGRVSEHLEAFLIRAESPRVSAIQEGAVSVEDSEFGGVCLGC
jgi:hypothetical protein